MEKGGFVVPNGWEPHVCHWARVRLPNGQIAWALWKEGTRALEKLRISRNLKVGHRCKNYT
jgi:hypothetical protein